MVKVSKAEKEELLELFPDEHIARAGKRYGSRSDYYICEKPEIMYELWRIRKRKTKKANQRAKR